MADKKSKKKNMVYTPQQHIPVGDAVKTDTGELAIRVKKPNAPQYEVVPIGAFLTQVAKAAEDST